MLEFNFAALVPTLKPLTADTTGKNGNANQMDNALLLPKLLVTP
jgi:hypothetical protein